MIYVKLTGIANNMMILAQMGFDNSNDIIDWLDLNCENHNWDFLPILSSIWFRFDDHAFAFKLVFPECCSGMNYV